MNSITDVREAFGDLVQFERHHLSAIWGDMDMQQFNDLSEDIQKNGLLSPILLYEEQILDGEHRYLACLITGEEPVFINYDKLYEGLDPRAYVCSVNQHRRHVSSPRALAKAAVVAWEHNLAKSGNQPVSEDGEKPVTNQDIADSVGVSLNTVKRAKQDIEKERNPEPEPEHDEMVYEGTDDDDDMVAPLPSVLKDSNTNGLTDMEMLQDRYDRLLSKYEQVTALEEAQTVVGLQSEIDALRISNQNLIDTAADLERTNKFLKSKLSKVKRLVQEGNWDDLHSALK